jgi:hypothetical protein
MDKRRHETDEAMERRRAGFNLRTIRDASVILALIIVAGALVLRFEGRTRTTSAVTPGSLASSLRPIDGVHCDGLEGTAYHIHTHLEIFGGGRQVIIPAGVGIPADCYYWLHTHDDSGIIHVEAPSSVKPTLGDFFDIWGQPLSRRRVANLSVTPGRAMRVYVNLKPYTGNPRGIILRDHMNITIEITPPFKPPSKYDFGAAGF